MATETETVKWEGWVGLDEEAAQGQMVWKDYKPKTWEETDIDIKVTHSGVCGSDVHVLRNGWVSSSLSLLVLALALTLSVGSCICGLEWWWGNQYYRRNQQAISRGFRNSSKARLMLY